MLHTSSNRPRPMRRLAAIAVGAVALLGASATSATASAPAPTGVQSAAPQGISLYGTCGGIYNPSTSGGHAHWQLSCSGGRITMSGYVVDDKADGLCAAVKGVFGDATHYSSRACPKGTRKDFSWSGPGSVADGYLFFS